jgi:hypothetical protein
MYVGPASDTRLPTSLTTELTDALVCLGWRDLGPNPSKGPPPQGLSGTGIDAGLVVISIAFTPDLRD